jgi:hypothetical protein
MSWTIRRLNPITDESLFHIAFGWLEDSPSWRRETEAVFATLDREQYLQATLDPARIDIGVFNGPEFIANVILTLRGMDIYEVHFEAAPDADPKTIIAAGCQIRDLMFGQYGMQMAYTWTPKWNRGVLAINKALGFEPSGVMMIHGTARGRLIDWVQYSIRRT